MAKTEQDMVDERGCIIACRASRGLIEALEAIAEREDRSRSYVMRRELERVVKQSADHGG
jgi:predicted transcriptional regulator